jgi:gamma-glutamylcyclotransferase (GGCT)/AIG2-like uncharacterized protein YtfP
VTTRLFVYGTLQPGATHWHLLEPYSTGTPQPVRLQGTLYDTGHGYPALRLGPGPGVQGWLVELRDPPDPALSAMDEYEGPEYRRVPITLPDNIQAWTYIWIESFDNLHPRTDPWPTTGPPGHS